MPHTAEQITLRDLLTVHINSQIAGEVFNDNSFSVEASWLPHETLTSMTKDFPSGKLYLVAFAFDEEPVRSRNNLTVRDLSIQLGFQKSEVDPNNISVMDTLVNLVDQIIFECRTLNNELYPWVRTESLKNENGVPYHYPSLQANNVFEAYFTIYYRIVSAG